MDFGRQSIVLLSKLRLRLCDLVDRGELTAAFEHRRHKAFGHSLMGFFS